MATKHSVGSPTLGLAPFGKHGMPFTNQHMYSGHHLASPDTPVTSSFAPPSLPTPVTSPERGGPFQPSMHVDFPHYKRFDPPTPTPQSAEEQSSPEKPVKRKPGRPPKSAAQKAADAAARKAAAALKKEQNASPNKSASSQSSRTGNARGRPSKQQQQANASPAKSDTSLPEPEMTPAQGRYAPNIPLGVGAHTPPAESELKAKRRRLWAPGQAPEQKLSAALQGLPSPSASDSGSSPSLAASSSSTASLQRRIDPVSGQCVYIHPESATPSLSSSCSTATSSSPPSSALQYLAQRLEECEGMVKAVIDGYGAFLIQWSDLKDRLGMEEALEAVAAGIKSDQLDGPDSVCEKIIRKYCINRTLSAFTSTSLEQEEKASRFKRWIEENVEEPAEKEIASTPVLPTPSSEKSIEELSPGMQGGKSLKPLTQRLIPEPEPRPLASVTEVEGEADAEGELDTPFGLDHNLPQSPQSVDEMRSASNTTPANAPDYSAFSYIKGGQGMTRQPTLVESSPVVRHTPKPAYSNPHYQERRASWGNFQHELLPPFPSTPPPSGDFYYDRGRIQRARQVSKGADMYDHFGGAPEFQSPGSFIPDITATPDRGNMARQLGLFPASSLPGVTYTPGPFSR